MKRIQGFSLIETTVALALLGVIVVTIMSAFSAVTLAATRHQQETTLDRLSRSDAEYIKSQIYSATPKTTPYLNLSVSGYAFTYQVLYYAAGPPPTFLATNADAGLQEIVLTVSGPNGSSETLDFLKVQP
jgi:prepilin-type N-terminal cleavage/methylation domain-containing protein